MGFISEFERAQIDTVLLRKGAPIERDSGLYLMPATNTARELFEAAGLPAMRASGLNPRGTEVVFSSSYSALAEVSRSIETAEIIVADVTGLNPDIMYVVGLCHGMGRCPLLLGGDLDEMPFNLRVLRCLPWDGTKQGLFDLREELTRAIRVFLAASRATGKT